MRVVDLKREVTSGGMKAERAFTVKAGAHMMSILSGLYKNPLEAIVREYLSNMNDAYVALRKADPKAVFIAPLMRVPTRLSPTLEFQDFGIGMDYEMVWEVYSQYGNSTKTENDDEVGGFGLGSKTAFCYNNGSPWNITAVKNGVRNRFMAFVGEDGIPQLTHISEEATTDHSGVTVSIPIRHQDVDGVIAACHKYAKYFPMELTVEGLDKPIEPLKYAYKGADWGMSLGKEHYGYRGGLTAVVGNVPYKVQSYDGYGSDASALRLGQVIVGNEWTIHLPIGSVDIVPSRDDLKYSDRTKATITAAVDRVIKEFQTVVEKEIQSAKSEWEVCSHLHNLKNKLIGGTAFKFKITWNGKEIADTKITRKFADAKKALDITKCEAYAIVDSGTATPVVTSDANFAVDAADSEGTPLAFIVVDNMRKGSAGVMRGLVRQKFCNQYNGRAARYGHKMGTAYCVATTATKKKIAEFFGGVPLDRILTTSDLKGVVPMVKGESEENIYRWDGKRHFAPRVNIPKGEDVYYYLPMTKSTNGRYGYNPTDSHYTDMGSRMSTMFSMAKEMGISMSESVGAETYNICYGVLEEDIDGLDSNWKDLSEVLSEKVIVHLQSKLTNLAFVEANEKDVNGNSKHLGFLRECFKSTEAQAAYPELITLFADANEVETKGTNVNTARSLILQKALLGKDVAKKITKMETTVKESQKDGVLSKNIAKRAKDIVESNKIMTLMFDFFSFAADNRYYYGNENKTNAVKIIKKNLQLALDNQ